MPFSYSTCLHCGSLAGDLEPMVFPWFNLSGPRPKARARFRNGHCVWSLLKEVGQALELLIFGGPSVSSFVHVLSLSVHDAFGFGRLELWRNLGVQFGSALGHVLVASAIAFAGEWWWGGRFEGRLDSALVISPTASGILATIGFFVVVRASRFGTRLGALVLFRVPRARCRSARAFVIPHLARFLECRWPAVSTAHFTSWVWCVSALGVTRAL